MTPLAESEIRARNRPLAILLVAALRLLQAFWLALPVTDVFEGLGAGRGPNADAALFEPGALVLTEVARLGRASWAPVFTTSVAGFVFSNLLALLALSGLCVALAHGGPLRGRWLGHSVRHWPRFVLLSGASLLAQALVVLFFVLVHDPLHRIFAGYLDERGADLCGAAWLGAGLAMVLLLGALHDLARAASVRGARTAGDAGVEAVATLRAGAGAVVTAWLVTTFASIAIVGLAALATNELHVERPGGGRLALVAIVHQLAVLALTGLRAGWLARCLRWVSHVEPLSWDESNPDEPDDEAAQALAPSV